MDDFEKELLESLKNFDTKKLFMKGTYVELLDNDTFIQGYIVDFKGKEKCQLYLTNYEGVSDVPISILNFYHQNDYPIEDKIRNCLINIDLGEINTEKSISYIKQKLELFNIKLKNNNYSKKDSKNIQSSNKSQNNDKYKITDKNDKVIDIRGYFVYQFLFGYILDCLFIINYLLNKRSLDNSQRDLFILILDIVLYMIDVVKGNLKKYKTAYYNRKLLIVSQLHGILIGFDTLLINLKYVYNFNYTSFPELDNRITKIVQSVYEIILSSKDSSTIPLPSLYIFIIFITYNNNIKKIRDYKKLDVYQILNVHFQNLNENELKYYKKNEEIRELCYELVNYIFQDNMDKLINQIYYNYLLSCLKCKNLEKKISALNDFNEIIIELDKNNKIDNYFKEFIEKNKILDIIFEESVHEQIIKRCINLFKYFSKYDSLNDDIIEKIINRQNNDLMKKLLIEIISELPKQKKDNLFQRLSKGIKLDNPNNIDFITKLTESCFNKSNIELKNDDKNDKDQNNKNYYGLNMFFDYIILGFDDIKKNDKNDVDMAIDSFEFIIKNNDEFDINDKFFFLDKLFDNIKNNNKHNSIIQSIKLIQNLLIINKSTENNLKEVKNNLKKLDEKYNIITLLVNDLMRYMKLLPNDYTNEKCKDTIYEGIYPHNINIELRLKLIFYFFKKSLNNYEINVKEKKHIEIIYQIFKSKKYKEEQKKYYEILTKNLHEIEDVILEDFFKHILLNKDEFNLKTIDDNETINLIIQTFKTVNENKEAIFYDGRNIRIDGGKQIEGFDILFDLLTQNSNRYVQNKISQILCDLCLSFKDYSNTIIPEYWKKYFDKITLYFDNISKSHDKIAFNGIIKLLNKIYSTSCNCYGKIPEKKDYKGFNEPSKLYHFMNVKTKKEYKLKAGVEDRLIDLRWKLGYYYDINVNNVNFIDLKGDVYSLNNDFEIFTEIFSDEKYFLNDGFSFVRVKDIPFKLLEMKDNPKNLIEKNENIYNILIDNLRVDLKNDNDKNVEIENKQKIWNIITKLPKNYYFDKKLKKFGNKEDNKENDLTIIFNEKEIYLLTYSLYCFNYFLFNKDSKIEKEIKNIISDKNEYLNNFIGIYHGDIIIYDKLLSINIDKNNYNPIQMECITLIIEVLNEIENYKENHKDIQFKNIFENKELYNNYLKKFTEIISNLLELNYIKYEEFINQINDDSNDYSNLNNERKKDIYEDIADLIEHIFNFIDKITKDNISYIDYLFNNNELFTKIFIYNYIKCENDKSREKLDNYLNKNYIKENDYINKYFEVILTVDVFNYLIKNDKEGKYFHVISSIMEIYYEKNNTNNTSKNPESSNKENVIESKHIKQSKEIIDIIIKYIQEECEKKKDNYENKNEKEIKILMKNNENFKEGLLLFLVNIIKLNPNELSKYIISKVDIYDLFLKKCILRKCVNKPLEEKEPFCLTNLSQNGVFKILLIILRNLQNDDLYLKIIEFLNEIHHLGFWKTYNFKNWDLESKEMQKWKYVGLKNMTSTCYLNSIIQQLYMIPKFRETILKINNTSENSVLYELQLLFSALKIYEFSYYDPRSFVVINKLNFYEQMDADEFYGTLIDKVENDIKAIYSKTPSEKSESTTTSSTKNSEKDNYKYKDLFHYFFGIKVLDELKFVDCGHKRYNEFFYNNIQLEIKQFDNIHESLKNYFKTEIMDGDNKINCEECKTKRTCHKRSIFKTLPNIFVIVLKRFEFDYNAMLKYKLNKYFEFPHKLDMKDYLIENHTETNTEYDLTGITIHYGVADFGHYYDLIKGPDNKWYNFNDISVSEFKEENIPKEAFGEKEIFEEDSYKEKEKGKINAYILIYKKKNFDNENIDKNNESDLALPPYSKYSNINDKIKNEINFKLYKTWTINNITTSSYQNFILQLLKMDLVKIIDSNIEKYHPKLIKQLKNEGYILNNKPIQNNKFDVNNNKLFEFALRYYFNVILRISRRVQDKATNINYFDTFKEIIIIYIENDINKAKFLLEEFSNFEAIDEYLVFCPNRESAKDCLEIIIKAFEEIYNNANKNDSFAYEFMNTIIIYIDNNIRKVSLELVNHIFLQILNTGGMKYINYLIRKSFHKWVMSFYGNGNNYINIINNDIYPKLHSRHSIIIDKLYKNKNNKKGLNEESDMLDQNFYNKLNNNKMNIKLIENLRQYFED